MLGYYEPGFEYWIYTKDIIVPKKYKKNRISENKWKHKMKYYHKTGEFESRILFG